MQNILLGATRAAFVSGRPVTGFCESVEEAILSIKK